MPAYSVDLVTTATGMEQLQLEWERLFHASQTSNPFVHPVWMITWARHFLNPSQLCLASVRNSAGTLVGLAPFYFRQYTILPGMSITSLQLFGSTQNVELTELSQVIAMPGEERPILRAIMQKLCDLATQWDWLELILAPEQGWFEPQWISSAGPGAGSSILHKATRACVILPLCSTWAEMRAGFKRNIKESIRHGTNSLIREKRTMRFICPSSPQEQWRAIEQLTTLHHQRSVIAGKVQHSNQLMGEKERSFLRDVSGRMSALGLLSPCLLEVDGEPVAARLLLHANRSTFLSLSGFSPAWWQYSVATTLMAECLRYAVERGDSVANLSPGPDVAKLRWSEHLQLYQEFAIVGPRRRSRLAFALYWQARAAALFQREMKRHHRAAGSTPPTKATE